MGKQCRWTVSISQRYWTNARVGNHVCQWLSLRPSSLSTFLCENIFGNYSVTENTHQCSTPNLKLSSSKIYRTTQAVLGCFTSETAGSLLSLVQQIALVLICVVLLDVNSPRWGRMFAFFDLASSASSLTISTKRNFYVVNVNTITTGLHENMKYLYFCYLNSQHYLRFARTHAIITLAYGTAPSVLRATDLTIHFHKISSVNWQVVLPLHRSNP